MRLVGVWFGLAVTEEKEKSDEIYERNEARAC